MKRLLPTAVISGLAILFGAAALAQPQPAAPAAAPHATLEPYKSGKGPFHVTVLNEDWSDESRKRTIPVRIFIPWMPGAKEQSKVPVIVFSHGWGASRTTYGYFGQHMASQGYLVIIPTHPGSDTASIPRPGGTDRSTKLRERLLGNGKSSDKPIDQPDDKAGDKQAADQQPKQEGMMESIDDPENLKNRPNDISFVIDQLDKQATTKPLADLTRIGVAGHSFGAYTAMAIGGMTVDIPDEKPQSFADPRVKAVLPMSPQGQGTMGIAPTAWDHFSVPVLFLTGTKDYGQGTRPAAWRRQAFDSIKAADDYLIVIDGATHMTFGRPTSDEPLIDAAATAFFDAYVCNDAAAKAWLQVFFKEKHKDCTAEFKAGSKAPSEVPAKK